MKSIGSYLFKFFFLSGFLVLGYATYKLIHETSYFPVKYVRVYGAYHVNHDDLQNLLTPFVAHNFFAVDVDLIKDRLRQYSWVEDISIRRVWPNQVNILITERKPIALWHDGNLLSSSGDLFSEGGYKSPPDLPTFIGPEGSQSAMLQSFIDFNRELQPLHAKIIRLELTSFQMWCLTLDNGIMLRLGHKNILTRLGQFVKVYPKIIGDKAKDVQYVDLRYPNGMAVKWKDIPGSYGT